ncbi:macro domain-containing protein [Streptosporangium sp. NPDC004379]|uniref:macro domain-containing protein n=1 Tax=Streptosporangium sp. NPDC004379 TaxID=3366189 RepID=UPI0036A9B173
MRQNAYEAFLTRRGIGKILAASLAAFGILSAAFQVALAIWPSLARQGVWVLLALAGSCVLIGAYHSWPRFGTDHSYKHPDFVILVKCGDIFNEKGNVIVGFTDTFDTDMCDGIVINPHSVQGQFQAKYYGGDTGSLDVRLDEYLQFVRTIGCETAEKKRKGKLKRYPIGTTVALNYGEVRIYALAYGFMRNDLRVSCSVDALWKSLTSAWNAVRINGSLEPVAIPIIGSELARVGSLDRTSLIKMIALSFVASSREEIVSRQLTIMVHPKDRRSVNLIDVEKFLESL